MRLQASFYRTHDPQWAYSPLSGEGAAQAGGRFNPRGVPTLYLASTIEGAIIEASHGFAHRFTPLTMVAYDVDVADIVDLARDEGRKAAAVELAELACAWRLDLANGREPASWRVTNRLRTTSAGILVPSFAKDARQDMRNLVLWRWGSDPPHRVIVHDPSGRLPKDQRSWETR